MPPKAKASKKVERKKQDKAIEDKTFGLKNKGKSKAVQKYVDEVTKAVKSGGRGPTPEQLAAKKKAAKEAKAQAEAELNALFDNALITGKKIATGGVVKAADDDVPVDTKVKQEQETYIVADEERGLEDIIEEQRAKLAAEGKKGTPVTKESLEKWKADRKAKKREEERKLIEEEMKKKKGGKGLSVLSGRALFDYDATLFKDDEEACATDDYQGREEYADDEEGDSGSGGGGGGGDDSDKKMSAAAAAAAVGDEAAFADDDDADDLDDLDDDDDDA